MKNQNLNNFYRDLLLTLMFGSLIGLSACSLENKDKAKEVPTSGSTAISSAVTLDGEHIGEIKRTPLSEESMNAYKQKLSASGLTPVPVKKDLNAIVYRLNGLSSRPLYFVAPKLFVYNSNALGKLQISNSGKYFLPFNIAIIDGLSNTQEGLTVDGAKVSVPETLTVKDYAELKRNIATVEHTDENSFEVMGLPGCPSKITINVSGKLYDASPADAKDSDFCDMNRAFMITAEMTLKEIEYTVNDALRRSKVDVYAKYGVVAPIPASQLTLSLNKRKLFEALHAELSVKYPPYASAHVEKTVEKVLRSSQMNVNIIGDYNDEMKKIVALAIDTFFTKFKEDPSSPKSQSCDTAVCFDFTKIEFSEDETLDVQWSHMENQRIEKVLKLSSKLKRTDDITSSVGQNPDFPASLTTAAPFTNKNLNPATNPDNLYSTGLLPQRGGIVIINPTLYSWERRSRGKEEEIGRRPWSDCTGQNWDNSCSYTTRYAITYTSEYTGEEAWVNILQPLGKVAKLTDDLKVNFKFENGDSVTCPLNSLAKDSSSAGITITIENSSTCQIFNEQRGAIIGFNLINGVTLDPITYVSGKREWAGKPNSRDEFFNTTKTVTYSPEVKMSATLTLLGTGIETEKPNQMP